MGTIAIARVYDDIERDPQHCILIDRLWPRGLAKADAPFSTWAKDVAPSTELRKWYDHDQARLAEFAERYRHELATPSAVDALHTLRQQIEGDDVILLTATKDLALSHASVLRDVLLAS
ncbi:MAG TPA: DUF488 family protein [Acidimicrobiales bacterium]|jgi:uncharacterized protein YeaO (DUF488 family)|nr:DUF488 family protein [Acidimicrobiales bacterium]